MDDTGFTLRPFVLRRRILNVLAFCNTLPLSNNFVLT